MSGSISAKEKLASILDELAEVSDYVNELLATLVDLEIDEDEDGLVRRQVLKINHAIWRMRWDIGPCSGEVRATGSESSVAAELAEKEGSS